MTQRLDPWGNLVTPQAGKYGEWFDRRLAERNPPHCDLCGEGCGADDFNDVAGMFVCPLCLEGMLDASPDDARSEVGLVGSGGGRA